jgi:hypothetical protein
MSLWVWILIASGSLLTGSLLVGLAVAAILGSISSEISSLLEHEQWVDAPLTGERLHETEIEEASVTAAHGRRTPA